MTSFDSSTSRRGLSSVGNKESMPRRHKGDHGILIDVLLLLTIGLIMIYSISPALADTKGVSGSYFVSRQFLAIAIAVIAFAITTKVPLNLWREKRKLLIAGGVLATLIAVVLPVNPNYPAHRWVRLGSLSFQSVEMLIFAIMIWFAHFLAMRIKDGSIKDFKQTIKPIIISICLIAGAVSIVQSDLGSTAVILAMMTAMAFIAGLELRKIMIVGAVIAGLVVVGVLAFPYRMARLENFLHPTANCQTTGYQSCQAMIAVGSGGISGLGLGSGVQAYGYLPEADNDSIFAIYAEKFGFIGDVVLLAIFGDLFYRISRTAGRAPSDFTRLCVMGVLVWISVETLINIGAMIGLLPLKGITLPFISYGGTSVVFFAAAVGLVYQVSRYTAFTDQSIVKGRAGYDYNSHGRRVRGAYHPNPSGRS